MRRLVHRLQARRDRPLREVRGRQSRVEALRVQVDHVRAERLGGGAGERRRERRRLGMREDDQRAHGRGV
jgi:hypothetical protein